MHPKRTSGGVLALVLAIGWAVPAFAQTTSAIVGVVRDDTRAVLPGVTVDVSSPALIGGQRSTMTSQNGSYRVGELGPGEFVVSFSLPGFRTFRREGIVLRSAFTATVDAVLSMGALIETVTVTGRAPVVDVRTNVSEAVLTQELKQAIPSGRTIGSIVGLAPGVVTAGTTGVDVAGTRALLNPSVQVHGSVSDDTTWNYNGLEVNATQGAGTSAGYYNDGLQEEVTVLTKALPAEVGPGGVYVNMTPKSGGDSFHGVVFANGTSARFQGENLTDELRARGLRVPTKVRSMYDFNPGFGGPILRKRLWFYASVRRQAVSLLTANQFYPDGSQARDENHNTNLSVSLAARINAKNQLSLVYDSAWKRNLASRTGVGQCVTFPTLVDLSATSAQPTTPKMGTLRWTSVLSPQVTFEAGASVMYGQYNIEHGPNSGNDVPRIDLALNTVTGGDACSSYAYPWRRAGQLIVSYTPNWGGSHMIRAGVQFQHNKYGLDGPSNGRGDWAFRFRNGVPDSVAVFNLPYSQLNYWRDLGLFVQDSWTIKNRMTLNVGARFESIYGWIPAQTAPAGRWVPERSFPEIRDIPNWTNVTPRLAFVYDLTGKGKTAIKANASRYTRKIGSGYMRAVNPTSRGFSLRAWNDVSGDRIPQLDELGPGTPFTGGVGRRYSPDIQRPYQWEYSASLQHELFPSVGVTLSYFHRTYYNSIGTKNVLVPPSAYTPVTITNPLTGGPITVYNQRPETSAFRDLVDDNYPEIKQAYNGLEVVVEKRLGRLRVFGGLTIGANKGTVSTGDLNNPNLLINNEGYLGNDATYIANVSAVYRLPRDFMLSGHWYLRTGFPLARNFVVTRALVPGLTQVNQTVVLVPRGEVRVGNLNLLDLRVSKVFGLGRGVKVEPLFEAYNLLNSNVPITEVQTVGPNLGAITESVTARLAKFGVKLTF